MTVIFSKRTGEIKGLFSGDLQTIANTYGEEAQDYALIWGEIQIPDDLNVVNNARGYKVNVETNQLEMAQSQIQYPTAQV